MIVDSSTIAAGPGIVGILYCSALWVTTMFIVLCHRSGIQIIGGMIACIGFLSFFIQTDMILAMGLFVAGCAIHWFGRLLYHLKNRG